MTFQQRLRFYLIGIFFGCIFVFVLFGNREFSCAYFPNGRVLDESHNKPKEYSDSFLKELKSLKLDTIFIQEKIFTASKIDFDKSEPRKKPCGKYVTYYPKKESKYEILFEKCENKVVLHSISKIE